MICSGSMPLQTRDRGRQASAPRSLGLLHKPEGQNHPGDPGADRDELRPLVRIDVRRIAVDGGDEQYPLVQDAIVPQVVGQPERDAGTCRR